MFFADTSKFRRYDDDSDSDEDFEEAKVEDVSDHELNVNDEINDSFKSADLSQSKSDFETRDQSLYETVSEVESDVYYGSGVHSVQVKEVLNQSSEINTEHQVDPDVSAKEQINQSDTEIKDDSFSSVKSETRNIHSEALAQLESSMDEKVLQKTSDAVSSEADRKMEVIEDRNSDNMDIPFVPEAQTMGIPVASLEASESASNISSNKFSRFNRRRRNTSGSDSDASGSSDLSSWSASQSRSKFEQGLNSDNEIDAAERSKSDVSSTPMSKGSINEEKELSDIMSSDSDSESSSSSSSDSSSSSPSSSTSLAEHSEMQSQKIRSSSSPKALSELDKKSVMLAERDSRGITKGVDFRQKNDSNKLEDQVKPELQLKENKISQDSHKPIHGEKSESRTSRKYDLLDGDNGNIKSRQYEDIKGRTINQREGAKSKYHNYEQGEVRHFKQISLDNEKEKVNKMKEQTKSTFGDKSYGKDSKKGEIEQIILDARRQKLESSENTSKETRTISLESRWQKEKLHGRKQDDFESQTKKKSDGCESVDHKKDSAVKVKNNVDKQESKDASHEKSRRYRRSRSKTPPKAYLKAVNKKAVKEKRLGSTTPPKAYSKDLKKVDKRKKSHSGDRKRRSSGSSKKNRITGDKRKNSENDTDKSISSLSDNESDSETENWRNKKTGASRKRDDIERERRIRQAAEREKLRQERKDREDKDRREDKVLERNIDEEHRYKSEIDSFDARDYRQHKSWENRSRFHRSLGERRSDEKVFYRKNKTFIEEEPHYSKSYFFEEEFSDDSKRNAKKGIVSVVKPDRKRRISEVDLEDIKISSRPDKQKKDDFSKKIKKERLIISVQESSEDENDTRSAKTRKAGSKRKKTKHKRSKEESTGESENEREKQSISVTFSKGKLNNACVSIYIQKQNKAYVSIYL